MDSAVEDIIRVLPARTRASRLAPYGQLIDELRDREWSFRDIAKVLKDQFGVKVSYRNVHHFVRSRAGVDDRKGFSGKGATPATAEERSHSTSTEVFTRIETLKRRPVNPESRDTVFEFDPATPLWLGRRGHGQT